MSINTSEQTAADKFHTSPVCRLSANAVFQLALACQKGTQVPLTDTTELRRNPAIVLWRDAEGTLTNKERGEVESWATAEEVEFKASVWRHSNKAKGEA